ncbi:MAG: AAA family ATPase [Candidatus Hydrogenedentales bacterium]
MLTVIELLRNAYRRSFPVAISNPYVGGTWGVKHLLAAPEDRVSFSISVGDCTWETELVVEGGRIDGRSPERALCDGRAIYERPLYGESVNLAGQKISVGDSVALKVLHELGLCPELNALVEQIVGFRTYTNYHLWTLREYGSKQSSDLFLHPTGTNAFSVLRNWRDKRDSRASYEWVREGLLDAFPDFFDDFDFEVAGQGVMLRVYVKGLPEPVPHHLAPDGFLVALLHLCAVAGAPSGGVLAIDEMENALHPYAIRQLVSNFRNAADERDLTIVLATHSPVVLDQFASEPGHIYYMQPGAVVAPLRLDQQRDLDWLSHFSIGKLYANLDFGAPQLPVEPLPGRN